MIELRTYVLSSEEALDRYATVHWARHIVSLSAFGVTTHHVWKEVDGDRPRLFALVEYADGLSPAEVSSRYMDSSEFRSDMNGFTAADILNVSSVFLVPAQSDPAVDANKLDA
ncbi:NIPSNAP family protein [Robbsia andropogonis]|uniref:NIPSNAP family protein n=1 Tax=Robbsia andropogonis TaxID=28092 RepID=UPI0020A046D8|nr:NIPSNAP family protein [Robbsia andropogonis]MCP1121344.1 NIPSNAP family protein [Robbsia andropogonis]MCP1131149.1 NIPSNAP family protein [Robbsia andropogonis]